jgi:hypothetical protein
VEWPMALVLITGMVSFAAVLVAALIAGSRK